MFCLYLLWTAFEHESRSWSVASLIKWPSQSSPLILMFSLVPGQRADHGQPAFSLRLWEECRWLGLYVFLCWKWLPTTSSVLRNQVSISSSSQNCFIQFFHQGLSIWNTLFKCGVNSGSGNRGVCSERLFKNLLRSAVISLLL